MSRKNQIESVEPYYQVPKIVAHFDKMTNDHQAIFMQLYDQLRQKKEWNKSNKELSQSFQDERAQVSHHEATQ